MQKNFGCLIFGQFFLILDKFQTKILDTLLKHSLSEFTPTKHELEQHQQMKDLLDTNGFTKIPNNGNSIKLLYISRLEETELRKADRTVTE